MMAAHYSTPPTGSVVLYVSAGDRFLTRGQPTDLLLLPSNQLPFSPLFAPLHLFCFIYLLIRITDGSHWGRQTVRLWDNTVEHTGFARDKRNKDVLFYSGGNYSIYNYQTWLHTMNADDKAKGHLSGMAVEEGLKKKKNYWSVIWKWISPLLSYIIHV